MPVIERASATGDRPLTDFANDDDAYDYAREHRVCVYDDAYQCVYCCRANH